MGIGIARVTFNLIQTAGEGISYTYNAIIGDEIGKKETAKAIGKNLNEAKSATKATAIDTGLAFTPGIPALAGISQLVNKGDKAKDIISSIDKIKDIAKNSKKLNVKSRSIKNIKDIEGFTKHGINRTINRNIKPKTIKDTIQNTKQYSKEVDKLGRKSFRYVGEKAEIIFNKSKEIITGWLKK